MSFKDIAEYFWPWDKLPLGARTVVKFCWHMVLWPLQAAYRGARLALKPFAPVLAILMVPVNTLGRLFSAIGFKLRHLLASIKPLFDKPLTWVGRCAIRVELILAAIVFCVFPVKKGFSADYKLEGISKKSGGTILGLSHNMIIFFDVVQAVAAALVFGRGTFTKLLKVDYNINNSYTVKAAKRELLLMSRCLKIARELELEGNSLILFMMHHLAWNDLAYEKAGNISLSSETRREIRRNYLVSIATHEGKTCSKEIASEIEALLDIEPSQLVATYQSQLPEILKVWMDKLGTFETFKDTHTILNESSRQDLELHIDEQWQNFIDFFPKAQEAKLAEYNQLHYLLQVQAASAMILRKLGEGRKYCHDKQGYQQLLQNEIDHYSDWLVDAFEFIGADRYTLSNVQDLFKGDIEHCLWLRHQEHTAYLDSGIAKPERLAGDLGLFKTSRPNTKKNENIKPSDLNNFITDYTDALFANPTLVRLNHIMQSQGLEPVPLLLVSQVDLKKHALTVEFLYKVARSAGEISQYVRRKCESMDIGSINSLAKKIDECITQLNEGKLQHGVFSDSEFKFWNNTGLQKILQDFLGRHYERSQVNYYLENTLLVIQKQLQDECNFRSHTGFNTKNLKLANKAKDIAEQKWVAAMKPIAQSAYRLTRNLFDFRHDVPEGDVKYVPLKKFSGEFSDEEQPNKRSTSKLFSREEIIDQEYQRLQALYPGNDIHLRQMLEQSIAVNEFDYEVFLHQSALSFKECASQKLPANNADISVSEQIAKQTKSTKLDFHCAFTKDECKLLDNGYDILLETSRANNYELFGDSERRALILAAMCITSNVIAFCCFAAVSGAASPLPIVFVPIFVMASFFSSLKWAGPKVRKTAQELGRKEDQGYYFFDRRWAYSSPYRWKVTFLVCVSLLASVITSGILYFSANKKITSLAFKAGSLVGLNLGLTVFPIVAIVVALASIGSVLLYFPQMAKSLKSVFDWSKLKAKWQQADTKTKISYMGILVLGLFLTFVSAYIGAEGDFNGISKSFAWAGTTAAYLSFGISLLSGFAYYLASSVKGVNGLWQNAVRFYRYLFPKHADTPTYIKPLEKMFPYMALPEAVQTPAMSTAHELQSTSEVNIPGQGKDWSQTPRQTKIAFLGSPHFFSSANNSGRNSLANSPELKADNDGDGIEIPEVLPRFAGGIIQGS